MSLLPLTLDVFVPYAFRKVSLLSAEHGDSEFVPLGDSASDYVHL